MTDEDVPSQPYTLPKTKWKREVVESDNGDSTTVVFPSYDSLLHIRWNRAEEDEGAVPSVTIIQGDVVRSVRPQDMPEGYLTAITEAP